MAITNWTHPLRWAAAWACALGALAGCGGGGGGGGGDDAISGTYQLDGQAELGVAGSIRAELANGVEGTPRCSLTSGTVPPGMAFGTDCSLTGTPSQAGTYMSQVRLTVSGRSGAATVNVVILVRGPELGGSGALPDDLTLLAPIAAAEVTVLRGYTPQPGDQVVYAVTEGSLPTGLTLDAVTGKLSGTPVALGSFSANLGATLVRNGQSYPLNTWPLRKNVVAPFQGMNYGAQTDFNFVVDTPVQTSAPTFFPPLPAGASVRFEPLSALPAGVSMDPATGIVQGRTLQPGTYPLSVRATITTAEGAIYTTGVDGNSLRLNIQGVLPRYDGIGNCGGRLFVDPFETVPARVEFNVFRFPLNIVCTMPPGTVFGGQAGDVYHYALIAHPDSGEFPPSWVSVDADSGVVSVTAPESTPGQGTPVKFGLQVTTTRGADIIATRQGWTLLVQ
jgi:Putative Ig domain